jgi:hypothetical protein
MPPMVSDAKESTGMPLDMPVPVERKTGNAYFGSGTAPFL